MISQVGTTCHVIFYVSDVGKSATFWRDVVGLEQVFTLGPEAVFLRAHDSGEPFDVGLLGAGDEAQAVENPSRRGVAHVAMRVRSLPALRDLYLTLMEKDLVIGTADHGTHVSLYAADPDQNEVEFCWNRPKEEWPVGGLTTMPIDLKEAGQDSLQVLGVIS